MINENKEINAFTAYASSFNNSGSNNHSNNELNTGYAAIGEAAQRFDNSILKGLCDKISKTIGQLLNNTTPSPTTTALSPNENPRLDLKRNLLPQKNSKGPRVQSYWTTGSRERSTQAYQYSTLIFGDGTTLRTPSNRPGVRFQCPKRQLIRTDTAHTSQKPTIIAQKTWKRFTQGRKPEASASTHKPSVRIDETANPYFLAPKVPPEEIKNLYLREA
jgi:hypothetical protein